MTTIVSKNTDASQQSVYLEKEEKEQQPEYESDSKTMKMSPEEELEDGYDGDKNQDNDDASSGASAVEQEQKAYVIERPREFWGPNGALGGGTTTDDYSNSATDQDLLDLPLPTKGNQSLFKLIEKDLNWPSQKGGDFDESTRRILLLCFSSMAVVFRATKLTKEGFAYSRLPSIPAKVARMLWSELLGGIETRRDPKTGEYKVHRKEGTRFGLAKQIDASITDEDLDAFLERVNTPESDDMNGENGLNIFGFRFGGNKPAPAAEGSAAPQKSASSRVLGMLDKKITSRSDHGRSSPQRQLSWFPGRNTADNDALSSSMHGPTPRPMFSDEKSAPIMPISRSRGKDPLLRYLRDILINVGLIELAGRRVDDDDEDEDDGSTTDSLGNVSEPGAATSEQEENDADDANDDGDDAEDGDGKDTLGAMDFSGWKQRKKRARSQSQYFQIYKDMQHQYGCYLSALPVEDGGFATLKAPRSDDTSENTSIIHREHHTMKRWNVSMTTACLQVLNQSSVLQQASEMMDLESKWNTTMRDDDDISVVSSISQMTETQPTKSEDKLASSWNKAFNDSNYVTELGPDGSAIENSKNDDSSVVSFRRRNRYSGDEGWTKKMDENPFNDETSYAIKMYPAHLMRTGRVLEAARILTMSRFFLARLVTVGTYDAVRRHRADLEELDRRSKFATEGMYDLGGDGDSINPVDIMVAAYNVITCTFEERFAPIVDIVPSNSDTDKQKKKKVIGEREPGEAGRALHLLAPMLLARGRSDEGMACFKMALDYKIATLGNDHISIARTRRHMGHQHQALGQYDDAIKCYEEALRVERLQDEYDYKKVVLTLNSLGMVYGMTNGYGKSIDCYWQSLAIEKAKLGEDHIQVAETLNSLGIVYGMMKNYSKAVECYVESLNIKVKRLGPIHPVVADIHLNLGQVHNKRGDRESALSSYHEALRILKARHGDDHIEVARVLHYIGVVLSEMGDLVDAVRCYEECLRIRRAALGDFHKDVARTQHNLGLVYYESGHYERSLQCFQETYEIGKKKLGKKNEKVADTLHSMGLVHQKLGQFQESLDSYNSALKIRRSLFGENHLEVASTLHNMGDVHYMTGSLEEAMECYREAYKIRHTQLGTKHVDVAATRNNMGVVYMKRGENEKAMECFTMALKIRERKLGKDHEKCSDTLHNMGLVYKNLKKYGEAIDAYEGALAARKLRLGDNDMKVADTLYNMAIVYANTGRYGSALQRYKEALRVYREAGMSDDHPSVVNTLQWIKWAQRKLVKTTKKGEHLQDVFLD